MATLNEAYNNASGYSASITNLSRISYATDNVLSDGVTTRIATVTGNVSTGYVATPTVGIAAQLTLQLPCMRHQFALVGYLAKKSIDFCFTTSTRLSTRATIYRVHARGQ